MKSAKGGTGWDSAKKANMLDDSAQSLLLWQLARNPATKDMGVNSALSACGKNQRWQGVSDLLATMLRLTSTAVNHAGKYHVVPT